MVEVFVREPKRPITLDHFAKDLKITTSCVQLWAKSHRITTFIYPIHNGRKQQHVDRNYAASIIHAWRRSAGFTEASRILRSYGAITITPAWLKHVVTPQQRCGVLGLSRLFRASFPELLESWRRSQSDVIHPERKGFARFATEKIKEFSVMGASKGGRAGHQRGTAHVFIREDSERSIERKKEIRLEKILQEREAVLARIELSREQRRQEKRHRLRVNS